jgi:hypothetical protein
LQADNHAGIATHLSAMRLEQACAKTSKALLRVICDQELIGIGTAFMRDSDRFPAPDEAGACAPKTLPASDR